MVDFAKKTILINGSTVDFEKKNILINGSTVKQNYRFFFNDQRINGKQNYRFFFHDQRINGKQNYRFDQRINGRVCGTIAETLLEKATGKQL